MDACPWYAELDPVLIRKAVRVQDCLPEGPGTDFVRVGHLEGTSVHGAHEAQQQREGDGRANRLS